MLKRNYGPVGATIWCAYWQYVYEVVSHNDDGSVTCRQVDHPDTHPQWRNRVGRVWSHRTELDKRDRILSLP